MPRQKRSKTIADAYIDEALHMSTHTARQERLLKSWRKNRRYRQDVFFLVGDIMRYGIGVAEAGYRVKYGVESHKDVPGVELSHSALNSLLEISEVEVDIDDDEEQEQFEQLRLFDL